MNVHRFDAEQRKAWVDLKRSGEKSVKKILKEAGIARATLYNWVAEFPEPVAAENPASVNEDAAPSLDEIRTVRSGGARHRMLQAALTDTDPNGTVRSALVRALVRRHTLSVPQACEIAGLPLDQYGYRPRKPEADDRDVYEELYRLLEEEGTRSFDALVAILKATQPEWPRKQIRRIYKEGRLYQRRAKPQKQRPEPVPIPAEEGGPVTPEVTVAAPAVPWRPDGVWNAGVALQDGQAVFFAFDTTDDLLLHTAPLPDAAPDAEKAMLEALSAAATATGMPRKLRVPGEAPFTSRELLRWAMQNRVGLQTMSLAKEENAAEWTRLQTLVKMSEALSA